MARKIGLSPATLRTVVRWSCALWIIVLAVGGLVMAYITALDSMMSFVVVAVVWDYAWASIPTGVFIVVIPFVAVAEAMRSAAHERYVETVALAAVPLLGLACSLGSYKTFVQLFTSEKLFGYEMQINDARRLGRDVEAPNISIKLGPPVTARFQQPGMSWTEVTFIGYDESDAMADPKNLNIACNETSKSLGGHFFFIDTSC